MPHSPLLHREHMFERLAVPALLIANIALACGPWLVRLAASESHVGPLASGFWRLAIAWPIFLLAGLHAREAQPKAWAPLFGIAIVSGLFFAIDLGLWHVGILHTRLANATLFGNVSAILFPAYGFLAMRRWPTRRQGLAIALAAVGAILLLGRSYELAARNMLGDVICIGAGLCYTLYLVSIDRVRGSVGPITILLLAGLAGAPCLLLFALLSGEAIWPADWTPLLLLAFGSQIIGQGMILFALSRVTPLIVGLMLLVQPIVASAIGWLIYGERLTAFDIVGGMGIIAAVMLVRDTRRPLPADEKGLDPAS